MKDINRRDFLKYTGTGVAALVVGGGLPWMFQDEAYAAVRVQSIKLEITDAVKNMATWTTQTNTISQCYFWIYKDVTNPDPALNVRPDCPGPLIFCTEGDLVKIDITNKLDEDHNFFIQGVVNSGPISPGATKTIRFKAPRGGAFLYHDNLNAPVNRVMGLHGALISMPRAPRPGHKFTPYSRPTAAIQKLFDDFGSSTHFPGLAWEQGDPNPATKAMAFRQYIWLLHQPSSRLQAQVGNAAPGTGMRIPANFIEAFSNDPFALDSSLASGNRKPDYFTISGQSGHFSHNNPFLCPNLRAGEPCVIRIMNAGLYTHSMHIHANHMFITYDSFKGGVQTNPIWIDVYTLSPTRVVDYVNPFMRPPDIPNRGGIGPMHVNIPSGTNGMGPGLADDPQIGGVAPGHPVWPPVEELALVLPSTAGAGVGAFPTVQLSPMCYPMHDHTEPSQTSQGGNYNMGMISGMNVAGDRNAAGGAVNFPNFPTVFGPEYKPNTIAGLTRPDGPEPA